MGDIGFYITLGVIVLIFGALVFMQTRRRKTAQAEYTGMLDTLRVGTRVKTVGGVIGKIKEIREEAPGFKTVLLETGDAKNPSVVLYDLQAIYGIVDDEAVLRAKAEAQAAQAQPASVQNHEQPNSGVGNSEDIFKAQKTKSKGKAANDTTETQ